jgi:hypothetical protein
MIRMARGAPYWLQLQGMQPLQVQAGDLVMLPLGAAHSLYSEPGVPLTPFGELVAPHVVGTQDEEPLVLRHGGADQGPPDTDMYSAMLWFSAYCRHSVFRMLPPLILNRDEADRIVAILVPLIQQFLAEQP